MQSKHSPQETDEKDNLRKCIELQAEASDPSRSCFFYASAGSGKTRTLVARILRLILAGSPCAQILCITYTNAASNEIRERIINIVSEWRMLFQINRSQIVHIDTAESADCASYNSISSITNDLSSLKSSILRYTGVDIHIGSNFLELLDENQIALLNIDTIHGLFAKLLHNVHVYQNLDFEILTPENAQSLINIAYDILLNRCNITETDNQNVEDNIEITLQSKNSIQTIRLDYVITRLLERHSIKHWRTLITQILTSPTINIETCDIIPIQKLLQISESNLKNKLKLTFLQKSQRLIEIFCGAELNQFFNSNQQGKICTKSFDEFFISPELLRLLAGITLAATENADSPNEDLANHSTLTSESLLECYLQLIETLSIDLISDILFASIKEKLFTKTGTIRKRIPEIKDLNPLEQQAVMQCAQEMQKTLEEIAKIEYFRLMTDIIYLSKELNIIYTTIKQKSYIFDYNDLIREGCKLLREQTIESLPSFYISHLLIDEMQDLSELQWNAIFTLTEHFWRNTNYPHTIFAVGDYKQSIFRFQGAMPSLIAKAEQYFLFNINKYFNIDDQTTAKSNVMQIFESNFSFRSHPKILKHLDEIFRHPKYLDAFCAQSVQHIPLREPIEETTQIKYYFQANHCGFQTTPVDNNTQNIEQQPSNDCTFLTSAIADQTSCNNNVQILRTSKDECANMVLNTIERLQMDGFMLNDIMILVRRRGPLYHKILAEASQRGILIADPCQTQSVNNNLICDLLYLFYFIINPYYEQNLFDLLRSSICALSEYDTFLLCKEKGSLPLYDQLLSYSGVQPSIIQVKRLLFDCCESNCTYDIESFLLFFLRKYIEVYSTLPKFLSSKEQNNLIAWLDEKIAVFKSEGLFSQNIKTETPDYSIESFVNFLFLEKEPPIQSDKIREQGNSCNTMQPISERHYSSFDVQIADCPAKITTIHSAKGLESKIVLVIQENSQKNDEEYEYKTSKADNSRNYKDNLDTTSDNLERHNTSRIKTQKLTRSPNDVYEIRPYLNSFLINYKHLINLCHRDQILSTIQEKNCQNAIYGDLQTILLEDSKEELRLEYVSLTRAKDILFIFDIL